MFRRIALGLAAILALSWLADTALWHLRGAPTATFSVDTFLGTPLKGQKEEYDYTGAVPTACTRAIYPHAQMQPCWYLRRHTTSWNNLPQP